jgi:hypothetical protein
MKELLRVGSIGFVEVDVEQMDNGSDDEDVVMSGAVDMVRTQLMMMTEWLVGYRMHDSLTRSPVRWVR